MNFRELCEAHKELHRSLLILKKTNERHKGKSWKKPSEQDFEIPPDLDQLCGKFYKNLCIEYLWYAKDFKNAKKNLEIKCIDSKFNEQLNTILNSAEIALKHKLTVSC